MNAAAPLSPCVYALLLLLAAGCAGGDTYSVDEAEIARRFLPVVRDVPVRPDSLAHLAITEKEGRLQFELDRSYEALLRLWSSTWQSLSAYSGRQQAYKSYATLWSLELSLAALEPEMGVTSLSRDAAERLLRERRAAFRSTLQIDVYQFLGSPRAVRRLSDTRLGGAGRTLVLEDDRGNTYRPAQIESGPVREGFGAGGRALYRRNTLLFSRTSAAGDPLDGARILRLVVRGGPNARFRYTWTFPLEGSASSPQEGSASSPQR